MVNKRKKLSFYFIAFLVIAFVFLAIGLGTLGSVSTTGKSYELMTASNENEDPSVVFLIKNITEKDEKGNDSTVYHALRHVYINVGALYSEEGKDVEIRLTRGSSSNPTSTSSTYRYTATLENLKPDAGRDEKTTAIRNSQFNWIAPFDENLAKLSVTNSRVSTYKYMKLTAPTHNLVINEVVFVGEKLTGVSGEGTGEYNVLPVEIYSATPHNNQTNEEAKEKAAALVDAQKMPNMAESSFDRFTKEETYTMMSIAEMKAGGNYTQGSFYHGDTVHNSFGTSVLAFGTLIFGMSPFGLRVFPMLASFGVLLLGFFFATDLFKSEKAGLAFAILYALSTLSLGFGHLGTPLMLGVFFFAGSVFGCYKFYRYGLKKGDVKDALPLVLSGLGGAAAICVNGAFLIPMLAVAGLFAAGMVKQQRARRYYLDLAIAEAEAEEAAPVTSAHEKTETEEPAQSAGREKVAQVVSEFRRKNTLAPVAFFGSIVLGALFLSLIFLIPTYYLAVKLFDNPASPSKNIFALAANFFAGGFVGANGSGSAWRVAYTVFTGTGSPYAVTSFVVNAFAGIAGLLGIAYAISRIVLICKARDREGKSELYKMSILLTGLAVCLITAAFARGGAAFIMLAYVFCFLLFAGAAKHYTEAEGKIGSAAKIVSIVGIVLLAVWFALTAVFTFSIPLPASFMKAFI